MSEKLLRLGSVTGNDIRDVAGTTLYTTPSATTTVVGAISVCNRKGSGASFQLWHIDGARGDRADEDVVTFKHDVLPFKTLIFKLGIIMTANHTLLVKTNPSTSAATSGSSYVTFIAWGGENI